MIERRDDKPMVTVPRWFSFVSFKCQSNVLSYANANFLFSFYYTAHRFSVVALSVFIIVVYFYFLDVFSFLHIDSKSFYRWNKVSINWFREEYGNKQTDGFGSVQRNINIDVVFSYLARFQQTFQFYILFLFYFILLLTLIFSLFVLADVKIRGMFRCYCGIAGAVKLPTTPHITAPQ